MLIPKTWRRPAYFHQFITVMKPSMLTTTAITETGRSTVPRTGRWAPGNIPFDKALVKAL